MNEKELISAVRMTARGVLRKWIAMYKGLKHFPPGAQLPHMAIPKFMVWALATKGCPGNLRTALQSIMDEWQEEGASAAKDYNVADLKVTRERAGL